jgi:hypothetical protein
MKTIYPVMDDDIDGSNGANIHDKKNSAAFEPVAIKRSETLTYG